MALDKIRTELIADDAVTAAKIPAGAVGTTEIAEGALSTHALQNTTSHTLSGTYSESKLYTSDAYVLGGDTTVNSNLVLSSVKGDDSDITLTDDGTTRTITGTGVLSAGSMYGRNTVTGMTGELGSGVTIGNAVTGGSGLNKITATSTNATITYTDSNGINPRAYSAGAYNDGYAVHTFLSSGTFTSTGIGEVEYLIVAGGGGGSYGGYGAGGGGGAGGMLEGKVNLISGVYPITIGGGGAGGVLDGANGTDSSFSAISATGGGGGTRTASDNGSGLNSHNGGSGGGCGGPAHGGQGISGQGHNGGHGLHGQTGPAYPGGGGGGAGAPGKFGLTTSSRAGDGGAGKESSISGTATYYAGGGGGSSETNGKHGLGGIGGGGRGGTTTSNQGESGVANSGGGGGSQFYSNTGPGRPGGSGIVILRYKT